MNDIERVNYITSQTKVYSKEFIIRSIIFASILLNYCVSHIGIYLDNIYIIVIPYGYCVLVSFAIMLKEKFYSK